MTESRVGRTDWESRNRTSDLVSGNDPPIPAERLRRAIAGLRASAEMSPPPAEAVDLTPKSAHEAITRQMVTDLAADVAEVKTRINAVIWLLVGAVAVDVVMRLVGVG